MEQEVEVEVEEEDEEEVVVAETGWLMNHMIWTYEQMMQN